VCVCGFASGDFALSGILRVFFRIRVSSIDALIGVCVCVYMSIYIEV